MISNSNYRLKSHDDLLKAILKRNRMLEVSRNSYLEYRFFLKELGSLHNNQTLLMLYSGQQNSLESCLTAKPYKCFT